MVQSYKTRHIPISTGRTFRWLIYIVCLALAITGLSLGIVNKLSGINTINSIQNYQNNFDLLAGNGIIIASSGQSSLKFNISIIGSGNISVTVLPNGTLALEWIGPSDAGGTVTSVGLTLPGSVFSVTGTPVTTTGTLDGSLLVQPANTIWAGPVNGADATPVFRSQVLADLPLPLLTNGQLYIGSTGLTPVAATLTGTNNQVIVTNGAASITLSTPQNIGATSSPTFASETLSAVTNQLTLGTTNTVTLSSTAPAASRTYTIHDAGAAANFVLDTGGSLTITNSASSTQVLTATGAGTASWQPPATSGTVTSVSLDLPVSVFVVSGSPVTSSGTLSGSLVTQVANTVWAGPTGGPNANPTFRALVDADIPDALSITMLTVSGATLLGTNTTCVSPLLPSCYDISNQACMAGPLAANCVPNDLHLTSLIVDNLIVVNGTISVDYVNSSFFGSVSVNGTLSCSGNGTVSNGCLNLGGYSCPMGVPLADSCIPASLVFYDLAVTNTLTVNSVTCSGGAISDSCIPDRVKTINGIAPTASPLLNFNIMGTSDQVIITPGSSTITLSTPQNIGTTSTPTFASETLSATTNQLRLGTTNTVTLSSTAPAASRIYTIHDAGAAANFVLDTGGALTITNAASTTQVLTATGTGTASWQPPATSGTVTSVALALPVSVFTISGSPVTSVGTLTGSFTTQSANTIWAGPTTGVAATPTFRLHVLADLPQLTNGQLYIGSTSASVVAATLTGTTNQVIVTNGAASITLSTPQNIGTASTPTFASETLSAVTNQLTLGTTNTVTISSTAPSSSRTYTIHDAGAAANFVLDTGGALTISGTATTGQILTATGTNGASWQAPKADGFTSTATAAGTTTLTSASTMQQYFTGSTTQTVVLPVVATLVNGARFKIVNVATGLVTIQSSGAVTVTVLPGNGGWGIFTCINTAGGTGVVSWSFEAGVGEPSGGTTIAIGSGATANSTSNIAIGTSTVASGFNAIAIGITTWARSSYAISVGTGSIADGIGAIVIGPFSQAGQSGDVAIGASAVANFGNCVAIGQGSLASQMSAVALGNGAVSNSTSNVAIGTSSVASGFNSIAIGIATWSRNSYAVCIGPGSIADGGGTTVVGAFAQALINGDLALGAAAVATAGHCVAAGHGASATQTSSVGIGFTAAATNIYSVAIGSNAASSGAYGVALGYLSMASQTSTVAIGISSVASAVESIAIGDQSAASATNSMAIGYTAIANGTYAVAIGSSAGAFASSATAVGRGSIARGASSSAFGYNSLANVAFATAIGNAAQASGSAGVAVGWSSSTTASLYGIAIGVIAASGTGQDTIAIGSLTSATLIGDIAIGTTSTATGSNSIGVGVGAHATGIASIAIGGNSVSSTDGTIAIGSLGTASGTSSISIGDGSTASNTYCVVVGHGSSASGLYSIAVGGETTSTALETVAIGRQANAAGAGSISFGPHSSATVAGAEAFGYSSVASGVNGIAVGNSATASNSESSAFGYLTTAAGPASIAIGSHATASVAGSHASGYLSTSTGVNSIAIGTSAYTSEENGVAIGLGATTGLVSGGSSPFSLVVGKSGNNPIVTESFGASDTSLIVMVNGIRYKLLMVAYP